MLELKIDTEALEPGERLKGTASWHLKEAPKTIYVSLGWHTEGKGDEDVKCVDQKEATQLTAQGYLSFDFELPELPYSFSGKLISLIWSVELVVDKESVRKVVVVSPTKEELKIVGSKEEPISQQ